MTLKEFIEELQQLAADPHIGPDIEVISVQIDALADNEDTPTISIGPDNYGKRVVRIY